MSMNRMDRMDPRGACAWCARCRRPAAIDPEELIGDGGGDPSLLTVLSPPDGWIGDPDDDGLVCGDCATPEEISDWMEQMAVLEEEWYLEEEE